MKIKALSSIVIVELLVLSLLGLLIVTEQISLDAKGDAPELMEPSVYYEGDEIGFDILYYDMDDDEGLVYLYLDGAQYSMESYDGDPINGEYFDKYVLESTVNDDMEFYFYCEDQNGSSFTLNDPNDDPFLIGNFLGWGELPVLSNPDVYLSDDGTRVIFEVNYTDSDGDAGEIWLWLGDDDQRQMQRGEGDPLTGQIFEVSVLKSELNLTSDFYFDVTDAGGSWTYLSDINDQHFQIRDFITAEEWDADSGGGNGNDNDDSGGGIGLPKGWFDNPEVVVGIVGLVAFAGVSAYGVWRKKKKHGRFSELLTKLDDVYSSYKLNPKRCETELEKIRSTINEDLKKNVIDENNYSILKERIDEILGEIRSESIKSEVAELPKDIELRIKDMLIDGEITRAEYDKLLPIIKGSDMTSGDKEKMEKIVGSWMKEGKKKPKE